MKNRLILFLLLALPLLAPAQVRYKATKNSSGTQVVRKESVAGSGVFDVVVSTLPSDAVRARTAGKVAIPYAREGKTQINLAQFGTGKYYDPNFVFTVDYRPLDKTLDQMRAYGQNLFADFQTKDPLVDGGVEKNSLPYPQRLIYDTESGLHGYLEGVELYQESLSTVEQYYQGSIKGPAQGYWVANIESSNEWWPGNNGSVYPGYPDWANGTYNTSHSPSWDSQKGKTIQMESNNGQTISLEALANQGWGTWYNEMVTRRTNRIKVMLQTAKRKGNGRGFVAYGGSMYQGKPDLSNAYQTNTFQDGNGGTSAFGGGDVVTINGRQYNLSGDIWKDEIYHLDYYYDFNFHIAQQDYNEIWQQDNPDKRNFPYMWSKIRPIHTVADQIGHFQCNDYRMKNGRGVLRPVVSMRELLYEANIAGIIEGQGYEGVIGRVPGGFDFGWVDYKNGGTAQDDAIKIWLPPYLMYSYYTCARWFYANRPGSGFHVWNAPGQYDLSNSPSVNHHLHTVMAAWQARADMQPYERFLGQSTLVEKPEVQIAQTGTWQSYDAIAAYNYSAGTRGVQKPVYQIRYLSQNGGYRVLILGGMVQEHGQERTDNVRYTFPGMSSPVTFAVKLRGPAAQIYEFSVASTDGGQTYTATPAAVPAWEKAGYAGRVN
jgi:hypothetical protein